MWGEEESSNHQQTGVAAHRVDEVREGRRGVNNGDLRLSLSSSLSLHFSTRRHAASHESVRKGKITIK